MKIDVLDHGYVDFIEAWGHGKSWVSGGAANKCDDDRETGIIEAARQSTQGSFRGWDADASHPGDKKLLKFLYENNHATPFEFAGMVIEVQAPIFVFREWHRHRTQSYNEMSARYSPLPDLYYVPSKDRLQMQGGANKQAQGAKPLSDDNAEDAIASIGHVYNHAEQQYQQMLKDGVPKELARLVMPVGHYSRMRASANLRNWLAFITLRSAPNAQWEIQQFSNAVHEIVRDVFPQTAALFANKDAA